MTATALACDDCPVRDKAVCSALDSREKLQLAEIGRTQNFAAGEPIFQAGDDRMACATLIEGVAKLSTIDENGVERIVALLHPSGFLGRLFATHRDFFATALTPCRLCLFPRADFERVMTANPKLTQNILERTLDALEESRKLIDLIGKRRAVARVGGFLLMIEQSMCERPGEAGSAFELPLTRGEIADLLGLTIETVSRQLGALEKAGAISRHGGKGILILDRTALSAVANA
ncbi:Crp/Fnr family transcriptional regulator [Parasphingopyxis marina]|uniref:Crp/Fnr family transcriptional regulator n=1 Tax=Parasphingopyxis marina TaxID=2761622 RepID=A0A842HZR2_9SPHN|nr:Crp/Fnr family transcriptional regulator [Parasphingopyxis marina]MBC2778462.1 Crp/Fnr family transcriptional regulator [Parasphingopyxis marina]